VAGLELAGSTLEVWIRPVSARVTEEVSLEERRYEDGQDVQLLDIVDVPLLEARPHGCQVENHLIDDTQHWRRVGRFDNQKLREATDDRPLWLDHGSSSNGTSDRVRVAEADRLDHSLRLIRPEGLRIRVLRTFNKRQVRAAFQLGDSPYDLVVTDTKVEARYLAKPDGEYPYPVQTVACISLGEPFGGYRYKLVASIIELV